MSSHSVAGYLIIKRKVDVYGDLSSINVVGWRVNRGSVAEDERCIPIELEVDDDLWDDDTVHIHMSRQESTGRITGTVGLPKKQRSS